MSKNTNANLNAYYRGGALGSSLLRPLVKHLPTLFLSVSASNRPFPLFLCLESWPSAGVLSDLSIGTPLEQDQAS
jgi:hypothetical protein